jgi:branched-chain amino acid transport system substrate-binding protein
MGRIAKVRLFRVAVFATAALLPLSVGACSVVKTGNDASPIVIGADLELSGVDAAVGTTYQRALQLKVDEINAAGGAGGHPIRLVIKDNHSDATVAVGDVADLINEPDLAAIVIGSCSECAMAVAKTVDDKQIPTISLAPANGVSRPVSDRRYVFKLGSNVDDDASILAAQLSAESIHKFAVLTTDDVNGTDAATAITTQAKKFGANPTTSPAQMFKASDTDLVQPVRTALLKAPEALVISAFPTQAALAATAARAAGFDGPMFFNSLAAGDLFLQTGAGSGAMDGVVMVAPQSLVIQDVIANTPAKAERRDWFNAYTSRYGAFSGYSLYAADAIQLVSNVVASTGGTDHQRLRDAMENAQFDGVSGPLRFTPEQHSGLMPQALTTVVDAAYRWRLQG